jgi:hypothetical protein
MPIELTAAQAATIAKLADERGGEVSLHQIADGRDVYVSVPGEPNRYVINATGEAAPTQED